MHGAQLGQRRVDAAYRDYGVADEAIGSDRTEVLREEDVERVDHRGIDRSIADSFEEPRGKHRREQDFGVDAVGVLLAQALRGITGTFGRRAIGIPVAGVAETDRTAAGDVRPVVQHRLSFDQPALAAIGQRHESWSA